MKRLSITVIVMLTFLSAAKCQILNYGIAPQFNIATQLVKNPSKPDDGTFQWNSMSTIGVNSFLELQHTKNINSVFRLGYCRKGFTDNFQAIGNNLELENREVKNKFDYINLDILGKVHLGKQTLNPYLVAGIEASYLLKKDIEELPELYTVAQYPDYSEYKKISMSYIIGVGAEFKGLMSLDLLMNMDFLDPVNTNNLNVRNWIWTAGLNVNINKLLKI